MRVENHANLSPKVVAEVEGELGSPRSFLEVLAWAKAQPAGTLLPEVVAEVVTQDEYTHDVIVPWRDGLVLVYDTT
jgi:hypothetical protein